MDHELKQAIIAINNNLVSIARSLRGIETSLDGSLKTTPTVAQSLNEIADKMK